MSYFFLRERAWIGTYCSVELCYAVKLGYQILQLFEGYVYSKEEYIFSKFMKTLAVLKLKVGKEIMWNSTIPNITILQHSATSANYAEEINRHLDLRGTTLELRQDDIVPDRQKRQLYKNFMNSTVGKFSQKTRQKSTVFATCAADIENIILNEETIQDFRVLGEDVCQLETRISRESRSCRKTNPVIGSFVTALSRIDMHKHILTLSKYKYVPLYTDTDSLIFFGNSSSTPPPLPISHNFGDFRKEYENLEAFCCIGKKNYAVTLKPSTPSDLQESGDDKIVLKVRGLSFKAKNSQTSVTFDTFRDFLTNSSRKTTSIPQVRVTKSKNPIAVTRKITHVKLATALQFNRTLTDSPNYITLPYGYKENVE